VARFLHHKFSQSSRIRWIVFSCLIWLAGFSFGIYLGFNFSIPADLILNILKEPRCFSSLLPVFFLPFFMVLLSLCFGHLFLSSLTVFLKAVSFSFSWTVIVLSFQGAGWLFSFLFLFSDFIMIPLLFFLWIKSCSYECDLQGLHLFFIASIGLLALSFDHSVIVPFLIGL